MPQSSWRSGKARPTYVVITHRDPVMTIIHRKRGDGDVGKVAKKASKVLSLAFKDKLKPLAALDNTIAFYNDIEFVTHGQIGLK